MADNSLPQDAAKRLLELKKKLLAGSKSSEKVVSEITPVSGSAATSTVPASSDVAPPSSAPVKKQPLTMKSLMSSRRSSRRGSEEGTQKQPEPEIVPVVPPTTFVSRLKEAPAHRSADGSKPKVISLTKTFVTTTQEREARQAEAEEQEEEKVKRPRIEAVVQQQPQLVIFPRTDGIDKFAQNHRIWLRSVLVGSDRTDYLQLTRFDRCDPVAFINHHRQFLKSI